MDQEQLGARRSSLHLLPILVASATLLWGSITMADVVGPPDHVRCSSGSEEASCHGSAYCAPLRCTDDDECDESELCNELDLCLTETFCGGWSETTMTRVEGSCEGGESCDEGTCQAIRVCVAREIFDHAGCGVGSRGAPTSSFVWLLAITPAFVVVIRKLLSR